jgi:hypothetical protein
MGAEGPVWFGCSTQAVHGLRHGDGHGTLFGVLLG